MVRCWNVNPDFRPPFENLRKRMESYIRDTVCNNDLDNKILVSYLSFHAFLRLIRPCVIFLSCLSLFTDSKHPFPVPALLSFEHFL